MFNQAQAFNILEQFGKSQFEGIMEIKCQTAQQFYNISKDFVMDKSGYREALMKQFREKIKYKTRRKRG